MLDFEPALGAPNPGMELEKHASFDGRLVMIGFGSIGQAALPLILRHIDLSRERILILAADDHGQKVADEFGVKLAVSPLEPDNYQELLDPLLGKGDFLLNLSVDVSSAALIEWCLPQGVFYLDASIEPWAGGYTDSSLPPSARSNYAWRD